MVFENEAPRAQEALKKIILFKMELLNIEEIKRQYGTYVQRKIVISAAHYLKKHIRSCDLSVRFGLNEFIVMAHSLDNKDIASILSRTNQHLSEMDLTSSIPGNGSVKIKMKIGYSIYPDDGETIEALLNAADERKEQVLAKNEQIESVESSAASNILIFRKMQ